MDIPGGEAHNQDREASNDGIEDTIVLAIAHKFYNLRIDLVRGGILAAARTRCGTCGG